MKKLHFFIIGIFLIFGLSCRKGSPGKNTPVVETIDGIEYIHNPAEPLYPEKRVIFEEELTVGDEKEGEEIHIQGIGSFAVDDNENLFISDWSDFTIKMFDKEGKYIRTIGKKGQGPGEFMEISNLTFLPNGNLLVTDFGNQRTNVFSPEGEFIKSYRYSEGFEFFENIFWATDNFFTCVSNVRGFEERRTHMFVKTFDFSGKEVFNYGEFKFPEVGKLPRGEFMMPESEGSVFAGDKNKKWIYHIMNGKYEIEVYDVKGNLFRKIDRIYKKVPYTEEDANKYKTMFKGILEDAINKVDMPEYKTITDRMFVDDKSNLWVKTKEEREENKDKYFAYDIFDDQGFFIRRTWSNTMPWVFINGKMYSFHREAETGVTSIRRYNVKWEN